MRARERCGAWDSARKRGVHLEVLGSERRLTLRVGDIVEVDGLGVALVGLLPQGEADVPVFGGYDDDPAAHVATTFVLADDPAARAQPIHLGFRLGIRQLRGYLKSLQAIGMNHVALNLRFNHADIEITMQRLAEEVLPDFLV